METHMNELPITATEYLTLAPNTQTSVDVFSDGVIQSVQNGEVNPLTVLIQLRAIAKASERILKEINSNILNEAGKYAENTFTYSGCEMTKAEHGTKYDFSNCNDPQWYALKAKESLLKSSITERETFLKSIKGALDTIDKDSGEVVTLSPPTKKSSSGLNVSIR